MRALTSRSPCILETISSEIADLRSAQQATNSALRSLPIKNTLTLPDAQVVQAAFQMRCQSVGGQPELPDSNVESALSIRVGHARSSGVAHISCWLMNDRQAFLSARLPK